MNLGVGGESIGTHGYDIVLALLPRMHDRILTRIAIIGQGDRCTRHWELLTMLMTDIVNYHSHSEPLLLTFDVDGSHTVNTANTKRVRLRLGERFSCKD